MSIYKHEIPILEHDSDQDAVLSPTHEHFDLHLPKKAVLAFLGDSVNSYAAQAGAKQVAIFETITKSFPICILEHKGVEVCLCEAPLGAPAATQLLDWLIGYGVRQIIAVGSCGALADFDENEFFVPAKALRDEGTSYHYLPPSRFAKIGHIALAAIEKTLRDQRLPYREVITWTTDGFYRETRGMISYRKSEGCEVVEMECAALASCAAFRGAMFGQILYTADSLASLDSYDERNWGRDRQAAALILSLDAVINM